MSKSLVLSKDSWEKINQRIRTEYPPSVFLIRDKMKNVLGFTPRVHEQWIFPKHPPENVEYRTGKCIKTIHLDFYNESKRTMFLLRYSEYIKE